jgi:hypothetical protein
MKSFVNSFILLVVLFCSCTKENLDSTSNLVVDTRGFSARITVDGSVIKNWKTTPTIQTQKAPLAGTDYYALRGGIQPDQLTLFSFGKFSDDNSINNGRLTIFIDSVRDTGTFEIGQNNTNNVVLTIPNANDLEQYTSAVNNKCIIQITKYDTIKNTVSGTFNFELSSTIKKINVENGIFTDIPFKQ